MQTSTRADAAKNPPPEIAVPGGTLRRAYRISPWLARLLLSFDLSTSKAERAETLFACAKATGRDGVAEASKALLAGSRATEVLRTCLTAARGSRAEVDRIVELTVRSCPAEPVRAYEDLMTTASGVLPDLAADFGRYAMEHGSRRADVLAAVVDDQYKTNFMRLLAFEGKAGSSQRMKRAFAHMRSDAQLLNNGYAMPSEQYREPIADPAAGRALYLAHGSLPFEASGYATRTQGLVSGMRAAGIEVDVVTRLGFPEGMTVAAPPGEAAPTDAVDGVVYHRLPSETKGIGKVPTVDYISENLKAHYPLIRAVKPAIVHAASNYINGVTANFIARKFGLKSIYEVRGLWETTRASLDPAFAGSDAWRLYQRMETEACNNADRVICITDALRAELVRRGVDDGKIDVVPNGVDTRRFRPVEPDRALAAELGFDLSRPVIGYVGSLVGYEGIDDLLHALSLLRDGGGTPPQALIVGQGEMLEPLKALARELGMADIVRFTGAVPHHEVERYYSLVSIAPFPRKPLPVCEMVSPLKPFEAMAMEKCVVVSSVAALAEIVEANRTGLIHDKGSVQSLAAMLRQLIDDDTMRRGLGEAGRRWVVENRDWRRMGERVSDIYQGLLLR